MKTEKAQNLFLANMNKTAIETDALAVSWFKARMLFI